MLFFQNAMPKVFWYLADVAWCNEDSENYCVQSVNEHIPQVLWIFLGKSDHVHQNGKAPGALTFISHLNIPNIELKPTSTFPPNETLAVACWDTLVYGTFKWIPDPRLLSRKVLIEEKGRVVRNSG